MTIRFKRTLKRLKRFKPYLSRVNLIIAISPAMRLSVEASVTAQDVIFFRASRKAGSPPPGQNILVSVNG